MHHNDEPKLNVIKPFSENFDIWSHKGSRLKNEKQTFYFLKVFYMIRLLKSVISLKHFTSFYSSNMILNI